MSIMLMDLKWFCHFDKPPRFMKRIKRICCCFTLATQAVSWQGHFTSHRIMIPQCSRHQWQ